MQQARSLRGICASDVNFSNFRALAEDDVEDYIRKLMGIVQLSLRLHLRLKVAVVPEKLNQSLFCVR